MVSESCFHQICLGCHPQETIAPGAPVQCHPRNWVSAQWVHNYGHPPPTTDSRVPIEYRCLKMVATPDDKSCMYLVYVISTGISVNKLERLSYKLFQKFNSRWEGLLITNIIFRITVSSIFVQWYL